jgi:hypothetical protein
MTKICYYITMLRHYVLSKKVGDHSDFLANIGRNLKSPLGMESDMKTMLYLIALTIILSPSIIHAQTEPELIIHRDPRAVTLVNYAVANGDSATVHIEKNARVFLEKDQRKLYYLKVYKRTGGNHYSHIASIRAEDKHGLIVFGWYRFEVCSNSDDQVVATMWVHTRNPPLTQDIKTTAIIIGVLILLSGIVWMVQRVRRVVAERRFRRNNPAVLIDSRWHN